MKLGSLCSGYGGLEMGVADVLDVSTVWVSDIDPGACKILAHRYPDVPNLGDMTAVDWSGVEPVDVLCGGTPCPDLSYAGKRKGMTAGTRSNLWVAMREAVAILRPQIVVWENVRGAYSACADSDVEPCAGCVGDGSTVHLRALGRVLGDLADLGYDTQWHGLRAADVGAPHGRFRVFVVATDTGHEPTRWPTGPGEAGSGWARDHTAGCRIHTAADPTSDGRDEGRPEPARLLGGPDAAERGATAADTNVAGREGTEPAWRRNVPAWGAAADPECGGRDGRPPDTRRGQIGGVAPPRCGAATTADAKIAERGGPEQPYLGATLGRTTESRERSGATVWGQYEHAIRRWENALGRRAPAPTEPGRIGNQRLSPRFVEWMMGLPDGWVCDVPGLTRNEQLKALGNGVVPQQAAAALRVLLAHVEAAA